MASERTSPRSNDRSDSRPAQTAPADAARSRRLEELIDLAQNYRRWSLRRLAEELDRDPHNLIAPGGNPRMDFVVRLAGVLDWSVQDVCDDLWGTAPRALEGPRTGEDWRTLDKIAFEAHAAGRFDELVSIARREYGAARDGNERAIACNRESVGHDGLGRYKASLEALRRGLREEDRGDEVTVALKLNLAFCHHVLGEIEEGAGIANSLVEDLEAGDYEMPNREGAAGYALYVRGLCGRVVAGAEKRRRDRVARRAVADLRRAAEMLDAASAEYKQPMLAAAANTARGAIIELESLLGERNPEESVAALLAALDSTESLDGIDGPRLESLGWWCIFGCNVAMRHVADEERLEQLMAVFTNKADEVAERLGNWALRERVWTLELERRRRLERRGRIEPWILDREDARILAGTMARFPVFRETGWQVLRSAEIIEEQ